MKHRAQRLSLCWRLWRRHPVLRVIELCVSRLSPASLLKPHLLRLVGCVLNTDAGIKKTAHTSQGITITDQSGVTDLLAVSYVSPPHTAAIVSLNSSSLFIYLPVWWTWIGSQQACGTECSTRLNLRRFSKCSTSCLNWAHLSRSLSSSLSEQIASRTVWIIY